MYCFCLYWGALPVMSSMKVDWNSLLPVSGACPRGQGGGR